jgi:hypothetical protein
MFGTGEPIFQKLRHCVSKGHFLRLTQLPSITLQSPIVPFSSVLPANPFGMNGPFRTVNENYNFQQTVPNRP